MPSRAEVGRSGVARITLEVFRQGTLNAEHVVLKPNPVECPGREKSLWLDLLEKISGNSFHLN